MVNAVACVCASVSSIFGKGVLLVARSGKSPSYLLSAGCMMYSQNELHASAARVDSEMAAAEVRRTVLKLCPPQSTCRCLRSLSNTELVAY